MVPVLLCIELVCYGIALLYLVLLFIIDCDLQLAFYEKFGKSIGSMKGKVVFITGASSGIGEHTAIALAKHGVKLVLTARRKTELERVKALCLESSAGKLTTQDVLIIPMDLLNFDSHESCFKLALEHFGHVDLLLNNAGRSQRALWENIELKVDKDMFDINVFAVINLTKIAVRYFNTRGCGHVAVTSSIAGIMAVPYSASYSGAKHAIHGYYNALRIEKLSGGLDLTVSIICPGPTFTNFLTESFTDKDGIKYGVSTKSSDRRMTGERCGQLTAIVLANKINETWIAIPPILLFTYLKIYFPNLSKIVTKMIGVKRIFSLRDTQEVDLAKEEKAQ